MLDRSTIKGPAGAYLEEYNASLKDPEAFWAKQAEAIHWFEKPKTILEYNKKNPNLYRWFPDGKLNTCYNCLDVHVQNGRGDQDAMIYDSPVTNSKKRYTYKELLDQVSTFAGGLQSLGVVSGDVVLIYMPMIPEAIIAMLACTRIGATHSVVFGGFASHELAKRIKDCNPKIIVSASCGVEPKRTVPYKPLLDGALNELPDRGGVQNCIIFQRTNVLQCELGPIDVSFTELMAKSSPVDALPVRGDHPHYILYTSGTTGIPKGIVRDMGGYCVAMKYTMGAFYDTLPGDVMLTGSDIGWVVGHSYIVYGPLIQGCTSILYEGKPVGTPDAGAVWRMIEEYKVKTLFVAPTSFRAIRQADPEGTYVGKYDLSSFRGLFLAGEHCDPATLEFCQRALSKYGIVQEAIDHWWQTELGYPAIGNAIGLGRIPMIKGACTGPSIGFDVRVIGEDGKEAEKPNTLGDMVLKLPLPPGTMPTLYRNDENYVDTYLKRFPGFYDTGDAAYIDEEGYIYVMGRTDDIINTAGHRLSTGGLEQVVQSHSDVAECAVVPVNDDLKGAVPIGFVVLKNGSTIDHDQLKAELVGLVREMVGPIASFKKCAVVKALPKTRSGKVLRGTLSKIANGQAYTVTPTIDDPTIFDYYEPIIKEMMGV